MTPSDVDLRRSIAATDGAAIARTFAAGGAVHLRDAVDVAVIGELRAAAGALLHTWAHDAAKHCLPDELEAPLARRFVPIARLPHAGEVIDALLHPAFRSLSLTYLGSDGEVEPNSHIRSIALERPDAHLPFHQDETILKRPLLNVWIPLDPCGRDAPGLEVLWDSWRELLHPDPLADAAYPVEHARLDPAATLRRFGEGARWCPEFRLGDAMVFAGRTVHRTHLAPGMTAGRMSAEFRLVGNG